MDKLAASTRTLTPSILIGIILRKLGTVDNGDTAFKHVRRVAFASEVFEPAIVLITHTELVVLLLTLDAIVDPLPETTQSVSITEAFASLIP